MGYNTLQMVVCSDRPCGGAEHKRLQAKSGTEWIGGIVMAQVVVCGDQSSGKSSVLEAITEIPFPRKENLCTRFATEIILRRAPAVSISTKIIPDKQRPATEKKRLEAFKSSIVDFNELPTLIDEATALMGLDDDGSSQARAFSCRYRGIQVPFLFTYRSGAS